jgi:hypothetical protein
MRGACGNNPMSVVSTARSTSIAHEDDKLDWGTESDDEESRNTGITAQKEQKGVNTQANDQQQKEQEAACSAEVTNSAPNSGTREACGDFEMGCKSAVVIGKCWFTLRILITYLT